MAGADDTIVLPPQSARADGVDPDRPVGSKPAGTPGGLPGEATFERAVFSHPGVLTPTPSLRWTPRVDVRLAKAIAIAVTVNSPAQLTFMVNDASVGALEVVGFTQEVAFGVVNMAAETDTLWVVASGATWGVENLSVFVSFGDPDPSSTTYAGSAEGSTVIPPEERNAALPRILATIRKQESNNNYTAKNSVSSASGAYQFIDSTWAGYGGYPTARAAPPAVQDAKAAADVLGFLNRYGGVLESVPAAWYTGSYRGPGSLDYNPGGPGNPNTVQQYVNKWLAIYESLA